MTDYIFYPVTGDGQTQATQFIWNTGQINWTTGSYWDQGSTLVFQDPSLSPGAVLVGGEPPEPPVAPGQTRSCSRSPRSRSRWR